MTKLKSLLTAYTLGPSSFLILSMMVSNGINLAFNAYLGRVSNFEQFGLIALVNTILYVVNIIFSAVSATVNHRVAYITARSGTAAGSLFFTKLMKSSVKTAIGLTLVWLVAVPVMMEYFHVSQSTLFLTFTPLILLGLFSAIAKGYIHGRFLFTWTAVFFLTESVVKLGAAVLLQTSTHATLTYLSIPLSVIVSSLVSIVVALRKQSAVKAGTHSYSFMYRFFIATIITGLATNAFLTFDVLLVKHYLSATQAGEYAFLSLVGKMIFFLGSLFQTFMIPFVSRDEGAHRDPNKNFYIIFALTALMTALGVLAIGPFGSITLPILFGNKVFAIAQYRTVYALAIASFTVANTITMYHLTRHHYSFSALSLIATAFMLLGISNHHSSMTEIISVVNSTSVGFLIASVLLHALQRNGGFILANIIDLISVVSPLEKPHAQRGKKRILIFNWRDTRHVFAGGAETYIHELAKRWVRNGHYVTVFCGNDSKSPRRETIDGVHIIRRGGFYFVYIWAVVYYVLRLRNKYDIIIDSENGIPFFSPLFAKREKIFLLMHHVHQEVFRKSLVPPFSWIAMFLEGTVMPAVYSHTEVITVSPSTKQEIIDNKLTTKNPFIIYNGIDTKRYKKGVKSKDPLIVYVGRLKYYKSINVFIKSAKQIASTMPRARFIIAGEGEEGRRLHALAARIHSPVAFVGKVTEDEKVRLLQQAWVVVNPSYMEGWGITVIEANACGTPVVASDVAGLRDSVKDGRTGCLVPYGDVARLSEQVLKILQDAHLRNLLSKNAITWAKGFSWDREARRSIAFMTSTNTHISTAHRQTFSLHYERL